MFDAARETFLQNSSDLFMDCPTRERAGWLCDSFFTARAEWEFTGDNVIEKNFLENFLLPESFRDVPRGMLPMCYPADHNNNNFIPNWAMWFVLELEDRLFNRKGDREFVLSFRRRDTSCWSGANNMKTPMDCWKNCRPGCSLSGPRPTS